MLFAFVLLLFSILFTTFLLLMQNKIIFNNQDNGYFFLWHTNNQKIKKIYTNYFYNYNKHRNLNVLIQTVILTFLLQNNIVSKDVKSFFVILVTLQDCIILPILYSKYIIFVNTINNNQKTQTIKITSFNIRFLELISNFILAIQILFLDNEIYQITSKDQLFTIFRNVFFSGSYTQIITVIYLLIILFQQLTLFIYSQINIYSKQYNPNFVFLDLINNLIKQNYSPNTYTFTNQHHFQQNQQQLRFLFFLNLQSIVQLQGFNKRYTKVLLQTLFGVFTFSILLIIFIYQLMNSITLIFLYLIQACFSKIFPASYRLSIFQNVFFRRFFIPDFYQLPYFFKSCGQFHKRLFFCQIIPGLAIMFFIAYYAFLNTQNPSDSSDSLNPKCQSKEFERYNKFDSFYDINFQFNGTLYNSQKLQIPYHYTYQNYSLNNPYFISQSQSFKNDHSLPINHFLLNFVMNTLNNISIFKQLPDYYSTNMFCLNQTDYQQCQLFLLNQSTLYIQKNWPFFNVSSKKFTVPQINYDIQNTIQQLIYQQYYHQILIYIQQVGVSKNEIPFLKSKCQVKISFQIISSLLNITFSFDQYMSICRRFSQQIQYSDTPYTAYKGLPWEGCFQQKASVLYQWQVLFTYQSNNSNYIFFQDPSVGLFSQYKYSDLKDLLYQYLDPLLNGYYENTQFFQYQTLLIQQVFMIIFSCILSTQFIYGFFASNEYINFIICDELDNVFDKKNVLKFNIIHDNPLFFHNLQKTHTVFNILEIIFHFQKYISSDQNQKLQWTYDISSNDIPYEIDFQQQKLFINFSHLNDQSIRKGYQPLDGSQFVESPSQ